MSNKIVFNSGKVWFGQQLMEGSHTIIDGEVKIHLFTNNIVLARTTVIGSFVEAAYGGYAAQVMSGWTDGGIDVNNYDTWNGPLILWQATSSSGLPETFYGYYVTDNGNTVALWGENFAPVQTFSNNGDAFSIPTTFSLASIFNN
jgi:hypothetical protein